MRIKGSHLRPLLALGLAALLLLGVGLGLSAKAAPRPTASPSSATDVLAIEQATHIANPLFNGSPIPQCELHGTFTVRNASRVAVTDARLVVCLQERSVEYALGTIAAGATATTEWSLLRTGGETVPVLLVIHARQEGRRLRRLLESREVLPPTNQGPPGGPPPGY